MPFTFSERKIDILNLNRSTDLLFLMRRKFYQWTCVWSYFVLMIGACCESRYCWTLKVC